MKLQLFLSLLCATGLAFGANPARYHKTEAGLKKGVKVRFKFTALRDEKVIQTIENHGILAHKNAIELPKQFAKLAENLPGYMECDPTFDMNEVNKKFLLLSLEMRVGTKSYSIQLNTRLFSMTLEQLVELSKGDLFLELHKLIDGTIKQKLSTGDIKLLKPVKGKFGIMFVNKNKPNEQKASVSTPGIATTSTQSKTLEKVAAYSYEQYVRANLKNYKNLATGHKLGKGIRVGIKLSSLTTGKYDWEVDRAISNTMILFPDTAYALPTLVRDLQQKKIPGHVRHERTTDLEYLRNHPTLAVEVMVGGTTFTIKLDTLVFPITLEGLAKLIGTEGPDGMVTFIDRTIKEKVAEGEIKIIELADGSFDVQLLHKDLKTAIGGVMLQHPDVEQLEEALTLDGWEEKEKAAIEREIDILRRVQLRMVLTKSVLASIPQDLVPISLRINAHVLSNTKSSPRDIESLKDLLASVERDLEDNLRTQIIVKHIKLLLSWKVDTVEPVETELYKANLATVKSWYTEACNNPGGCERGKYVNSVIKIPEVVALDNVVYRVNKWNKEQAERGCSNCSECNKAAKK